MVMQNLSGQAIADAFCISVDTAYRWRKLLLDDLRKEAVTMQPRDFIMESVSSLRRARAEAWSGFQSSENEKDKRAYLNLIVQTENQYAKIGERIGLYGGRDDRPMVAASYNELGDDEASRSAVRIQKMLLDAVIDEDAEVCPSTDDTLESYHDLLAEIRWDAAETGNKTEGDDAPELAASPEPKLRAQRRRRRPEANACMLLP